MKWLVALALLGGCDAAVASYSDGAEGGLRLAGSWNMIGARVEIEVAQVIGGTTGLTENYIRLTANNDVNVGYIIRYGSDGFAFMTRIAGQYTRHVVRPYDATQDRYWRIWNGPVVSNARG